MTAGKKAIVLGSSIAGLLTARALSPLFEEVLLIERDDIPQGPVARKGVPQSFHSHVMRSFGRDLLENSFPGIDAELEAAGAPLLNWGKDCVTHSSAGRVPKFETEVRTRNASRVLLEWVIRRRVMALSNVKVLEQTEARGLLFDAGTFRVTGVEVRNKSAIHEKLEADFVVDATGRGSVAQDWLQQMGLPVVSRTVVNAFLGYSTRWYEPKPGSNGPFPKGILVSTKPPTNPRSGIVWAMEGNRWLVTLGGVAKDFPPTGEAEFFSFAQSLSSPIIADLIQAMNPISPIQAYRRTENLWRHFEKMPRWPARFAVLGDSLCAFNPYYGQGMTVAAHEALLLQKSIQNAKNLDSAAPRFQRVAPKAISTAWTLATSEDMRWIDPDQYPRGFRLQCKHWYVDQLMSLSADTGEMAKAFYSVSHLHKGPLTMMRPQVSLRVAALQFKKVTDLALTKLKPSPKLVVALPVEDNDPDHSKP